VKQCIDFYAVRQKLPVNLNLTSKVYLASLFHVLTVVSHACWPLHS